MFPDRSPEDHELQFTSVERFMEKFFLPLVLIVVILFAVAMIFSQRPLLITP